VIQGLEIPYWLGTWFGVYPTWEGLGLQLAAVTFVIGSYYLAEGLRKHRLYSPKRGVAKSITESG
jgi:high-affinity iron transporter